MNLRNWSKAHTFGLLIGIATTCLMVPLILWIYRLNKTPQPWFLDDTKSKIISLASIANLAWFHWFMKKKNYALAMGIILATFINFFIIIYYKLLA